MSDEKKKTGSGTPEENDGLSAEQREKFDALVRNAGLLEQEINALVAAFELRHNVSCLLAVEKHNRITVDIAADSDGL